MELLNQKRAWFDQWAKTYDEDVKNPSGILEGYNESLAIAANTIDVKINDKVLDIGIGTGGFAKRLAQRGAAIYGIDLSPNMLDECRKKHPDYTLCEGVFTKTHFPDQTFDAVISSFCFHEVALQDRQRACDEVFRVLKQGGHFVLLDVMFASVAALGKAKQLFANHWDNSEDYSFVHHLDGLLCQAGFSGSRWLQTARCHWVVVAKK